MVERKIPTGQHSSALNRWSRRKQQARTEHEQQTPTGADIAASEQDEDDATGQLANLAHEAPALEPVDEPPLDETEEPLLTDADMPPLESLDSNSDLSCFFNSGVSEKLRQAALRRLLRLPAFNITDGLNDYDEDYTVFEPLGDIVTSDMRFHAERKAKLAAEEEEAARLAQHDADAGHATAENAETDSETETETETDEEMHRTDTDTQVAESSVDEVGDDGETGSMEAIDAHPGETPLDQLTLNQAAAHDVSSNSIKPE